ncbi:hypothetical protein EMQ25_01700 [Arsenicitalea aurantiaca]|uniref:Fimbrial protein n=1 Tax=Arsenicitalea aurantiaca TaxID=1783274 RepID=A0A433XKX0_9HYPH|nr:hypothetical protein [Arsenicitalea aurantiaca]RUT34703.1 hypothetical protein EMQ25_01700 [Arsenicitalea aurantiaca]
MSDPKPDAEPEAAPLSPEAQALMARARRSFAVSMGVLLFGFMAIAGVLVYRASQSEGPTATAYALGAVSLPAGSEILSAVAADGQVTVTYRNGPSTSIRVFSGEDGRVLREIAIIAE